MWMSSILVGATYYFQNQAVNVEEKGTGEFAFHVRVSFVDRRPEQKASLWISHESLHQVPEPNANHKFSFSLTLSEAESLLRELKPMGFNSHGVPADRVYKRLNDKVTKFKEDFTAKALQGKTAAL